MAWVVSRWPFTAGHGFSPRIFHVGILCHLLREIRPIRVTPTKVLVVCDCTFWIEESALDICVHVTSYLRATQQDRQCTCNVILWRVNETIVVVEKQ